MLERILVPLDGSGTAERVLPHVRRLALRQGSEVVLLRVLEPRLIDLHDEAESYLQAEAAPLAKAGLRVRAMVRIGSPAETILEIAEKLPVSLIAMTTHGQSGFQRWIFGSVAVKLLHAESKIPIYLHRPEVEDAPIRRLLVPTDGSDESLAAVPYAIDLAKTFDAEIVGVTVRQFPYEFPNEAAPERKLEALLEPIRALRIPAVGVVQEGNPAERILETAKERGAGAIVMSTHGRSGVSRWVIGSVAEKVIAGAEVPVLVVRG